MAARSEESNHYLVQHHALPSPSAKRVAGML